MPFGHRGQVDWVTGASVLLRTEALRDAGMFDTGFFLYYEEVELMHRFSKFGWKTYHCPDSRVVHIAGASTGVVDGKADRGRAPPPYLFRSRHRYFALSGGRMRALCADLAWLAGALISMLINIAMLRKSATLSWSECKALMQIGIGAEPGDDLPAVTRINHKIGDTPAWLKT